MDRNAIIASLQKFARRWAGYSGTERSEAQTFCNEFFACFNLDRRSVGARFEEKIEDDSTRVDLVWPGRLLIEMKRPSETDLRRHYSQMYNYWLKSNPSPQYVILCNFRLMEIHDPLDDYGRPVHHFSLNDLAGNLDSLAFMIDEKPTFPETQSELTKKAAELTTNVYKSLLKRYSTEESRLFILQCVYAMFTEDISVLPKHQFTHELTECYEKNEMTGDRLLLLFQRMNEPDEAKRRGRDIPYFNGGLFKDCAIIDLNRTEMENLRRACSYDWAGIRPEIFGTLFESSLSATEKSSKGAHFTLEADIQRIVQPCIVQPWMRKLRNVRSLSELKKIEDELREYKVLDPACGSGNFLYVAYRELKRVERAVHDREAELTGRHAGPSRPLKPIFSIQNLHGIDLDPFAVMLTRVTLWIGQQLVRLEYGTAESDLPLPDLNNIQCKDALFEAWPKGIDVYISNPPFLGAKRRRKYLGDEYVDRLHGQYPMHNGLADLCTFFFRRVHDEMGEKARAGLFGTSELLSSRACRSESTEYITQKGGHIFNAWSSYKWPGQASVHVCIVNWMKETPDVALELNGQAVHSISTCLRPEQTLDEPYKIKTEWAGLCNQGIAPRSLGFLLTIAQADDILSRDSRYANVIRPYLRARALQCRPGSSFDRHVIDFSGMDLEEAEEYPLALQVLEGRARQDRTKLKPIPRNNHARTYWWRFGGERSELRAGLSHAREYIAVARHSKHPCFTLIPANVIPDSGIVAILSDSKYLLGLLTSRYHLLWAWRYGSTLKADLRYTPSTIYETFPFPTEVTADLQAAISDGMDSILLERARLMEKRNSGLTSLYNRRYPSLVALHEKLDCLVRTAYHWAQKNVETEQQAIATLHALNRLYAGSSPR